MPDNPRVAVAHDDALVREMLVAACTRYGLDVVGQATTYSALFDLCMAADVDVAIIADRLDETPLETTLPHLLAHSVKVIVLSADPSVERLGSLLILDVCGYFSHDADPDEVARGVAAVSRGEVALAPAVVTTILSQWRRLRAEPLAFEIDRTPALTRREQEIAVAMADGMSTKAIAVHLGIAPKTVENHKTRIFTKLGVRSQAHAVTVAFAHGLVLPTPVTDDGLAHA